MDDYTFEGQEYVESTSKKATKKPANDNKKPAKKTHDGSFEFGKTYRLNEDGTMTEAECDASLQQQQCGFLQVDCCTIKIPRGFRIIPDSLAICVDDSNLKCIKTPITATVPLTPCYTGDVKECNVVAGYEIGVVGSVTYVLSVGVSPISGAACSSNVGCSIIVPVNSLLAHSCSPTPCPNNNCYTRFTFVIIPEQAACEDTYLFRFVTFITSSGQCA